jgi:hypothetical protein
MAQVVQHLPTKHEALSSKVPHIKKKILDRSKDLVTKNGACL